MKNAGTEQEVTSFPIRVALDQPPPGALPGMSGTVHVSTETHDKVLVLPIQCVTVRPQKAIAKAPGPARPNQDRQRGFGSGLAVQRRR